MAEILDPHCGDDDRIHMEGSSLASWTTRTADAEPAAYDQLPALGMGTAPVHPATSLSRLLLRGPCARSSRSRAQLPPGVASLPEALAAPRRLRRGPPLEPIVVAEGAIEPASFAGMHATPILVLVRPCLLLGRTAAVAVLSKNGRGTRGTLLQLRRPQLWLRHRPIGDADPGAGLRQLNAVLLGVVSAEPLLHGLHVARQRQVATVATRGVEVAHREVVRLPSREEAIHEGVVEPEEGLVHRGVPAAHRALLPKRLATMQAGAYRVNGQRQRPEVLREARCGKEERAVLHPSLLLPRAPAHAVALVHRALADRPACGDAVPQAPTL
mmetsp:Transcript_35040/g.100907  ORF Transcript_35040/g.100907 Transcript_35040/m.100907 type:complete len:327 (-) Transcript_35040:1528-2508(-)